MFSLLATTLFASAVDSLNPTAITQQFVLQGMVQKPKHICFFILATAITNFVAGLVVYFGFGGWFFGAINFAFAYFGSKIFVIEFAFGVVAVLLACYLVFNNTKARKQLDKPVVYKFENIRPRTLFVLGVVATFAELATAIPYFAFLTVLLKYQLDLFMVIFVLFVYNVIYSLPLIFMYFMYVKKQELFESFYLLIKSRMKRWSDVGLPLVIGFFGMFFVFHAFVRFVGY